MASSASSGNKSSSCRRRSRLAISDPGPDLGWRYRPLESFPDLARFLNERSRVNRPGLISHALERSDNLAVQTAMVRFGPALEGSVQLRWQVLQSEVGHAATITVPFWLSRR